ncbi:MAG: pirin family protein [Saprospiraceae bacterium]|nr:pirin family protein [Candidatus Vicinibacter proximus]
MVHKKVKYLLPSVDVDMGGTLIKQALPNPHVVQVDPFLLLHHGKFSFTNLAPALHQGIGPHPHRGFSPVTFVVDGEVHHRDSRGNSQIARKGDVQWLNAGAGIIHSERPSQELTEHNGQQEIIQLWINTPASNKMKQPSYHYFPADKIPTFHSEDQLVTNKLIAGKHKDIHSMAPTAHDLLIIWSDALYDGNQIINTSEEFNTILYIVHGIVRIGGYGIVDAENLLVFDQSPGEIEIFSKTASQYILLSGAPLNEKVVQQGPFVMNSETEILMAMRDYQMGKMGMLIEE